MDTTAPLHDRHALVCGASAGIGRATARALAAMGARVTCLARRADRLNALVAELGPRASVLVADLDDRPAMVAKVQALIAARGPVHLLINNAGGPAAGPLLEATEEAFLTAFGRHVLASQVLVKAVLPGMKAANYGRIVNIISTSVYEPIENLGVSNTIRGAMAGWSKTLSRELPPGITINNVLPGFTDTERLGALAEAGATRRGVPPEAIRAGWLAQVPEGRLARAEETAAAIAFLCTPMAGYIRGVSLPVDGGRLRGI